MQNFLRLRHWHLASMLLLLVACGNSANSGNPAPDTSPQDSAQVDTTVSEYTITNDSMGPARLRMTLGELKQALGDRAEFEQQESFMVDFEAIAVRQDGDVQFYIVYGSWETMTDADPITMLFTDNPNFRTSEGVGPDTPLSQAEAAYGTATLNYNSDNEFREYVQFANPPFANISFRSKSNDGQFAGIYGEAQDGSYYETTEYKDDATIGMVMLDATRLDNAAASCDNPIGTEAFNSCTQLDYEASDAQLNQTYQLLMGQLDGPAQKQLITAQRTWIAFRDADCRFVTYGDGSTPAAAFLNTCLATVTINRTDELEKTLGPDAILNSVEGLIADVGTVTVDGQQLNCSDPTSTPEINYCASLAFDAADNRLNQVYQQVMDDYSSGQQEALVDAQLAWIPFRDAHCEFAVRDAMGGTGYSSYLNGCLQVLTEIRTAALEEPEGWMWPF